MSTEISKKEPLVKLTWYGRLGDWVVKNQGDIALVIGFVLVALIAFGAGYLSAPGMQKGQIVIEGATSQTLVDGQGTAEQGAADIVNNAVASVSQSAAVFAGSDKGLIVASKSSKIYHWPWEAAAKKIKLENQVWFKSEAEAQASGRTKSADFDKLAPAGYKSSQ